MNAEITALVATWRKQADTHENYRHHLSDPYGDIGHVHEVKAKRLRMCADELERLAASRPAPAPHAWPDCPDCGAEVLAWSDTVDGSSGAHCTGCGREFFAPLAAPADLVALVRRVMNAYTRELEARNAWVISAPQSRESFELFEVVQAREADTRAAFLALHAFPLPEVPDDKA